MKHFEEVFCVQIILLIISTISIFIIQILKNGRSLKMRHHILVQGLGIIVFLFYKILLGHPKLIVRVRVL